MNDTEKLQKLLGDLDLPEMRKDTSKPSNVRWLLRNIGVRNSRSNNLTETIRLLLLINKENTRKDRERRGEDN